MEVRTKVWIEDAGEVVVSDWRIALLEAVAATGSLAAAARRMNVPYRTAWQKLKAMEARCGMPLVITTSGGEGGGTSRLTPQAQELIQQFHSIVQGVQEEVAARFDAVFGALVARQADR
jgi:molybdate transport system regulatory protein